MPNRTTIENVTSGLSIVVHFEMMGHGSLVSALNVADSRRGRRTIKHTGRQAMYDRRILEYLKFPGDTP